VSVAMIPAPDERTWLIDEFAALLAAVGRERLVAAPILEPTPQWFPDRWTPSAAGVRRLARRLLRYAGLERLDVEVTLFHGDRDVALNAHGHAVGQRHHGAAAWFAGITDDVCSFGAEVGQLDDPLGVTAAMAHEVAHVFRRVHGVEVEDRDVEERLTDLTTVLLGFGVLTTNASSRHRSAGGGIGVYSWSHRALGYLPPQAMSFLLAVQAVARGLDGDARRHLAKLLEANQRGFFEHAIKHLEREHSDLAARLGLSARATWPDGPDLRHLRAPLDDDADDDDDEVAEAPAPEPRGVNSGRPVFRIERTRKWRYAGLAALAGMASLPVIGLVVPSTALAFAVVIAGALAGAVAGRRVRADHCADPDCKALLAPGLTRCPGCDGTIAGTIAHPDQRLEAAEAYARRKLLS
jgi:hypothetical protein